MPCFLWLSWQANPGRPDSHGLPEMEIYNTVIPRKREGLTLKAVMRASGYTHVAADTSHTAVGPLSCQTLCWVRGLDNEATLFCCYYFVGDVRKTSGRCKQRQEVASSEGPVLGDFLRYTLRRESVSE